MNARRIFLLATVAAAALASAAPAPVLAPTGHVVEVAVQGEIDLGLAAYLERVLDAAQPGDGVVLRVDTFGGRIDAAVGIRDAILRCKGRTLAFVEGRAISAGALITLGADRIYMTRGATMGAATPITLEGGKMRPVEAKVVSYFRKEMKSTAEAKGRRGDIAEAMVDPAVVIAGIDDAESTLTLTTAEAIKVGVIDGEAASMQDALSTAGWPQPVVAQINWAESLARFLDDSAVSSLLMTLGLIGICIELWAPGHLMAGLFGAMCLALFFFGHWVVHLAGLGEVLLFIAGGALVVGEILLLPGHGVLASFGALAILGALVLALVGRSGVPLDVSWAIGNVTRALTMVSGALLASLGAMVLIARKLPSTRFGKALVLDTAIKGHIVVSDAALEVGQLGRTLTALRPAGTIEVDGRRVDVVSQGAFIEAGQDVRVVTIDGSRVVVNKIN